MADYHDHLDSGAPGDLEMVRAFINTCDIETGAETLTSPDELSSWVGRMGLAEAENAGATDLARAIELREALRAVLLSNNGFELDSSVAERMNNALSGCKLEVHFADTGATLVPAGTGVEAALARLATIVRDAMQSGEWQRMKVCPADDCLWAFYDRSRNRSRTWCQMEACGNRAKVRAFRDRRAH